MTKKSIALTELADKGSDVDILRDMLSFVSQQLMDMEVANRCNAGYGERTSERDNARNGYRQRDWKTRAGTIELQIPKLRKGSYFPSFLEARRTAEKA